MEHIKRFFECLIPVTACNLKCNYCYVIQRDNRKMKMPELKYNPNIIGKGLTVERLGGICYFSICGAGETLLPQETVDIVYQLLKNGHYVNVTTNGTLEKRFDQLLDFPDEYLERLHIAFSLHYNELIRLNKLNIFFENVRKMRKSNVSILVQINLCDEYIPVWDEIKQICIKEIGAPPQVAATRKEIQLKSEIELLTDCSKEEYIDIGREYKSPLFDFTMRNFNKNQKDFCYAGDWTGTLNLGTGILTRCYGSNIRQDIFKDITKPIKFCAIGKHCKSRFCMNSSHFLSLGVIPTLDTPTYAELRNRREANWYTNRMHQFLSEKLKDNNKCYSKSQKLKSSVYNMEENILKVLLSIRGQMKKVLKK